jgi:hypothetical protein
LHRPAPQAKGAQAISRLRVSTSARRDSLPPLPSVGGISCVRPPLIDSSLLHARFPRLDWTSAQSISPPTRRVLHSEDTLRVLTSPYNRCGKPLRRSGTRTGVAKADPPTVRKGGARSKRPVRRWDGGKQIKTTGVPAEGGVEPRERSTPCRPRGETSPTAYRKHSEKEAFVWAASSAQQGVGEFRRSPSDAGRPCPFRVENGSRDVASRP